jgi:hypothetical protein
VLSQLSRASIDAVATLTQICSGTVQQHLQGIDAD